ncbi:phospholipase D-like domain-containing protein [Haloimpatiens sp. FM7330]|uniref:phospholipase D-like domain-containing protein n=1 Tax=Haloimpatiens sp. FM7330 TaxID=3298610 RepID=UPI003631DFFF
MGLVAWIKSKLLLRKKSNEEEMLQELRKEINNLKEENRALKEKIIVFPKRNNEEIPIKFFDENIEEVIIKNIRETKKEIYVAMAWFTSKTLMDELNNLKRRGIDVKVMISDAKENNYIKNFNKHNDGFCKSVKYV